MLRSEFLRTTTVVGVGALCCAGTVGALLTGCASGRFVDGVESNGMLTVPLASFDSDDGTDAVANGKAITVRKTGSMKGPIYVVRTPDNSYTALSLVCTHKGCIVRPVGQGFECPCHGSEFSADGAVTAPPAKEPLTHYSVTADAQNVYIKL